MLWYLTGGIENLGLSLGLKLKKKEKLSFQKNENRIIDK